MARHSLYERRPACFEGLPGHTRLDLEPLSAHDSQLLLQAILLKNPSVPLELCDMILAGAAGNPFYIEEMVKMLIEERAIDPGPTAWRRQSKRLTGASVPPTLTGVLQARLDHLPGLERALLQGASAIGYVFWDNALERLSQASSPSDDSTHQIQEALDGLCRKELIQRRVSSAFAETIEYSFKHELLRDVVYEGLLKEARRAYHAQAAAWFIERSGARVNEFAGLVAVHFEQAGLLPNAAEWYGRAGLQARVAYAPAAAIDYLQKALALGDTASTPAQTEQLKRLEWYEGLSDALTTQARFTEALPIFNKVCALAEAAGDLASQARAWNGLAFLHERQADNRASIAAAEQAESLARGLGTGSHRELIRALHLKGWAYYRLGDAPKVLVLADQTQQLSEQFGERQLMAASFKLYGVAHLQLGHYTEADHYFEMGLSLCLEFGDRRDAGAMFSNLGESARLRGDSEAAVELYEKALAIAREIGERPSEMIYLSNLSGALLGLGKFKEAETNLRLVVAQVGNSKSCSLSETYAFLAKACLGQDKLPEALDAAQQAVAIGQDSENLLDLAGSWRILGQVTAAIERSKGPEPIDMPALARDPAACFAQSLRLYENIGAKDEMARTLLVWADFDQQQGRAQESRDKSVRAQGIMAGLAGG